MFRDCYTCRNGSESDFLKHNNSLRNIGVTFWPLYKVYSTVHWKKGALRKHKVRQQKLLGKLMLITFFDYQGII